MNVFILGDSTTKTYDEEAYPQQGSGYYISKLFKDGVNVTNYAQGGYSLKNFIYSPEYISGEAKENDPSKSIWSSALEKLQAGDYMIICWAGINDMLQTGSDEYRKKEGGSYVRDLQNTAKESYLPIGKGFGDYEFFTLTSTLEEYKGILKDIVISVKEKVATPILVKTTGKYYKVNGDDKNVISVVRNYSEAVKDIAEEENVIFADAGEVFEEEFSKIGYDKMLEKYFLSEKAYESFEKISGKTLEKPPVDDNVHYNMDGAKRIAEIFFEKMQKSSCTIKEYFKN